jgi:hypothetical protein
MTCKICNKDSNLICLCGFCQECIKNYGHEECSRMVKEMECKKSKDKGESK